MTGCSPNYLVYAHQLRLPPPIGELHWDATMAALAPTPSTSAPQPQDFATFVDKRQARVRDLVTTVHKRIVSSQRANSNRATARLAAKRKGGRKLCPGDLAYLLTRNTGFKTKVDGPFLVCKVTDNQAVLRTTAAVQGQDPFEFAVHLDRVVRCTTVTDVLQDLLKQAGFSVPPEMEHTSPLKHVQVAVTSATAAFVKDHYIDVMI